MGVGYRGCDAGLAGLRRAPFRKMEEEKEGRRFAQLGQKQKHPTHVIESLAVAQASVVCHVGHQHVAQRRAARGLRWPTVNVNGRL